MEFIRRTYKYRKRILIISSTREEALKLSFEKTCESGEYIIDVRNTDTAKGALASRDYVAILCFIKTIDRKSALINHDSFIRCSNKKIPFITISKRPTDLDEKDMMTSYQTIEQGELLLSQKLEIAISLIHKLKETTINPKAIQQSR